MNLTFPEIVNVFNKEKLIGMILNGPDKYPGAKYIKKSDSKYRTIRLNADNVGVIQSELQYGDIVERHLCNGDYVLFNRQPSLHKMSMMAHKVRVMEYDTFRLNVCCTPSYNADYDGDEMNMHVPQSLQTENELIELASVSTQIISPKDSAPIISVVQDIALGIFKMTHDDVNLLEKQVFNLLANNTRFTGKVPMPNEVTGFSPTALRPNDTQLWSGQKILSSVFPPTLNTAVGNVVIENGEIKKGILSKKTYQDMTNGVVHAVYNDLGKEETASLFDNTQRLVCDWLVYHGFSVGVSDLIIDKKTKADINVALEKIENDVDEFFNVIHRGAMDNNTMLTNEQYVEKQLSEIISSGNKTVECSVIHDENIKSTDNRLLSMINSKSKGNLINVIQMMGTVGQCSVDGKRINYGFDNRTLPHYCKYNDGPEARGFVKHSFIDGLTPQEFFFHAMGGREGLIDTAVKPSETGYLQRKLVKAMEDMKVHFDMSVRNANGQIIQFLYGDDGMHSCKLEKQHMTYLKFGTTLDDIKTNFFAEGVKSFKGYVNNEVFKRMSVKATAKVIDKQLLDYFNMIIDDRQFIIEKILKFKSEATLIYPIAFNRTINNIISIYALNKLKTVSDLSVDYIFEKMEELYALKVSNVTDGNRILHILLRHFFNPKRLIQELGFTKDAFDYLCKHVEHTFYKSLVHPSELVGVVSAQIFG
jgi:DNA-directed RNA polymerase II subunit RPB1